MDIEPSHRQLESLHKQLAEAQENLSLIEERIAQYVQETDVPLQLIKDQRRLEKWIGRLQRRITELRPIEVLRTATKLITITVAEVIAGEAWKLLAHRLLEQASRLPRSSYLDTTLLESSVDDMIRLMDELQVLLEAHRIEPNVGQLTALQHHAAQLADYVVRIYRLPTGSAPELEGLARSALTGDVSSTTDR
jgi:hypothetical protein